MKFWFEDIVRRDHHYRFIRKLFPLAPKALVREYIEKVDTHKTKRNHPYWLYENSWNSMYGTTKEIWNKLRGYL